jgi:hypothetical protein
VPVVEAAHAAPPDGGSNRVPRPTRAPFPRVGRRFDLRRALPPRPGAGLVAVNMSDQA